MTDVTLEKAQNLHRRIATIEQTLKELDEDLHKICFKDSTNYDLWVINDPTAELYKTLRDIVTGTLRIELAKVRTEFDKL